MSAAPLPIPPRQKSGSDNDRSGRVTFTETVNGATRAILWTIMTVALVLAGFSMIMVFVSGAHILLAVGTFAGTAFSAALILSVLTTLDRIADGHERILAELWTQPAAIAEAMRAAARAAKQTAPVTTTGP
jgi:hypothetical protein